MATDLKVRETQSLRAWRAENDITLEELSDVSGWSIAMLSRIERGERRLSALEQIRLARLLGVKVRQIFAVPQDQQVEIGA